MTCPSPRPRPKPVAKLGVESKVTQKSPSERLTGVADKEPRQATFSGLKFVRSETPIGFEAAHYLKTGVDLALEHVEHVEDTMPDAAVES